MKNINLAVVGPGLIGKKHIELIKNNNRTSLTAIIAPDHAHNHIYSKEIQKPLFFDLESCFSLQKIDGVIISSPNKFHFEQAKFCIKNHIPVLIEKPITATVKQGEELVQLAEKYNAKVLIGHHRAHSPLLTKAQEIIKSGRLGKIVSVTGSAQFYKPKSYFEAGPWRTKIGGGPILINLIHEIGNLRSLCGEIIAVHAFASSHIRKFPVEDTVSINLMFEDGVLGTFILSDTAACAKSWEQTSQENTAYPTYADEDCYVISGTLGSLAIPTFRLNYYQNEDSASWWQPFEQEVFQIQRKDPLACQLDHFIDIIENKAFPRVSAKDGLRNLQITEAISQSAKNKKTIYFK